MFAMPNFDFKILISQDALYGKKFENLYNNKSYRQELAHAIGQYLALDEAFVETKIVIDRSEDDKGLFNEWYLKNTQFMQRCIGIVDLHGYYGGIAYVALAFKLNIPVILYKTEAGQKLLLPYDLTTIFNLKHLPKVIPITHHTKFLNVGNISSDDIAKRHDRLRNMPTILTAIRQLENRTSKRDIEMIFDCLEALPEITWTLAGVFDLNKLNELGGERFLKYVQEKRIVVVKFIKNLVKYIEDNVFIYVGFQETGSARVVSASISLGIPTLAFAGCDCGTLLSSRSRWTDQQEAVGEVRRIVASREEYIEHCEQSLRLLRYLQSTGERQYASIFEGFQASNLRNLQSGKDSGYGIL